ncbi:MAG TPA: hypothetical protein VM223_02950, partial [Planctomycetota bacterium]|nr:hypothetical protein [Planctomycetota bacterium]
PYIAPDEGEGSVADQSRQLVKSEVGARAVIDLEEWYERQWKDSRDFKDDLIDLLDAGGREMLESLPDGIHSGLAKAGAKGVFFYFQAAPAHVHGVCPRADAVRPYMPAKGEKQHFWKYYDLKENGIVDNRYVIANLIACERDTPRVVDPAMFRSVFDLQEKVIEDILRSVREQKALEAAPRSVDPVQQTLATAIQSYLNHPDVDRQQAIAAIRFLNQPMLAVQVKELRGKLKDFQASGNVAELLKSVDALRETYRSESAGTGQGGTVKDGFRREDLRLVCFEFVSD